MKKPSSNTSTIKKKHISRTSIISARDKLKQKATLGDVVSDIVGDITDPFAYQPDIHILQKEGISIKVSQVREFLNRLRFKPFSLTEQIGIILDADLLTVEAQNMLLKTLEEPPAHTFYILCTDNHKKLLETILSRSQILLIGGDTINEENNFNIDPNADLIYIFDEIQTLTQSKDNQKKDRILNLLKKLLDTYRGLWLKEPGNERLLSQIKAVERTQEALEHNVNSRIALESLFLQLQNNVTAI